MSSTDLSRPGKWCIALIEHGLASLGTYRWELREQWLPEQRKVATRVSQSTKQTEAKLLWWAFYIGRCNAISSRYLWTFWSVQGLMTMVEMLTSPECVVGVSTPALPAYIWQGNTHCSPLKSGEIGNCLHFASQLLAKFIKLSLRNRLFTIFIFALFFPPKFSYLFYAYVCIFTSLCVPCE